jgi:hypothetical protein
MLGNAAEHVLEPFAPPDSTLVVRGGAWNSPAAEVDPAHRLKMSWEKWLKRDPKYPWRAWWLTDAPFVGFRVVRLADDGGTPEERAAAAAKIELRGLKLEHHRHDDEKLLMLDKVTGELAYSGARPLEEVEITVYYLDEGGKPMLRDPKQKPCFGRAWPALLHSGHPGDQGRPLRPGEVRRFEVELPHPHDEVDMLEAEKIGARVTRVRFAR